jgi:putative chitinase
MTPEQLARATGASLPNATKYAAHLTEAMASYGIHGRRAAMFLAQIAWESTRLAQVEENLKYSAKRLTEVWPRRFPTLEAARPYAMNPEALAEKTYGGRMGNTKPGDGWRYRGRGLKQLTGNANYRKASAALMHILGVDIVENPDLVAEPAGAAWTAAWFWSANGLNELADRGDYAGITQRINGGMTGHPDREAALRIAAPEVASWTA